jgi:hypothetical protein
MSVERTADPSAALGMTKGRAALPCGVTAVMTKGSAALPFGEAVVMTKERAAFSLGFVPAISTINLNGSDTLPFVIPSVAEGSAVLFTA